jgi:glycosyltransferase involved in cell wall biosynthesis
MRVLHVLPGLQAGGIEQLALQVIQHAPAGHSQLLLNTDRRQQQLRPAFRALRPPLPIHDWPAADGPRLAWRCYRLCRSERPTALLLYAFQRPTLWLALGARLAGVRSLAVHLGNPAPADPGGRRTWRLLLRLFAWLGVRAVPCSQAIVASFAPLPAGLSLAPVIANGCDCSALAAAAAASRAGRPAGDPCRILMVARLDPIKDPATLLRAWAPLATLHPDWQLQLVGEGSDRAGLERLAVELGLNPRQVFLGRRDDIGNLLGQADLFAFSTTASEGFGIALIEAMAAGLPLLASDVPACREVLRDGAAGVLLPAGDVDAWRQALVRLIHSPDQRLALATAARAAAAPYDSRHCAARWFALLDPSTGPARPR